MKVSLVIPALNEAVGIASVVRRACFVVDEIVIVDGGSKDATVVNAMESHAETLKAHPLLECELRIIVETRRGYGLALLTGIKAAKHPVVATADADGTYPIEAIADLAARIESGESMFISTVRFPLKEPTAMSYRNYVGNRLLTWVANKLFRSEMEHEMRDVLSGMFVFRKELIRWVTIYADGWDFSQELKLEAARFCGRFFTQAQIHYSERHGDSKLQPWRVGWSNLLFFFKHKLEIRHWFHSPISLPEEKINVQDWDKIWESISRRSEIGPATDWRARLIEKIIVMLGLEQARIVNFGCGVGSLEKRISQRVGKVWFSLDPSAKAIESAIREFVGLPSNVHFVHAGLCDWASFERQADLFIVSEVIEHIEEPAKFLLDLRDAMDIGAIAIVTCPNGPISLFEKHIGHFRHYLPDEIRPHLPEGLAMVFGVTCGWPFMNLMKRCLMISGERAIDMATGKPGKLHRFVFWMASQLFRFNSTKRGYQTVIVLRKEA